MRYTSNDGKIEPKMTLAQAQSVTHPGPCAQGVLALSRLPAITRQLAKIDPTALREKLDEYGAWDTEELADHQQNLQRILWLTAGALADGRH